MPLWTFLTDLLREPSRLLAEQTTTVEVVAFLVVAAAGIFLLAATSFVTVLAVFWFARHRRHGRRLRDMFLPSKSNFRERLPDYLLAGATSIILTLAVAAKHEVVDAVARFDLASLDAATLLRVLPNLHAPEAEHLVAGEGQSVDEEARRLQSLFEGTLGDAARVPAAAMLKPAYEAGYPSRAAGLAREIVNELAARNAQLFWLNRTVLLAAAIVTLAAYLLWLAFERSRKVGESQDQVGPLAIKPTSRRLFTLAASIALLLAAPSAIANPQNLANAAVASTVHDQHDDDARQLADRFRTAIEHQHEHRTALEALDGVDPQSDVMDIVLNGLAHLDSLRELVMQTRDTAHTTAGTLTAWRSLLADTIAIRDTLRLITQWTRDTFATLGRLETVDAGWRAGDRSVLDALRRGLDVLAARIVPPDSLGLLVVSSPSASPFSVASVGGTFRSGGNYLGTYLLPPGRYRVVGQVIDSTIVPAAALNVQGQSRIRVDTIRVDTTLVIERRQAYAVAFQRWRR
jgi:hypothetical protein